MALFKVMRGNKDALSSQELHDGYAWYTIDEGGFYIDAENSNSQLERKKINDAANVTLSSSDFSESNVKAALEGMKSSITEVSLSYDSETETVTFLNS